MKLHISIKFNIKNMELVTMTTMEISKLLEALILNDNTEREREKGREEKEENKVLLHFRDQGNKLK